MARPSVSIIITSHNYAEYIGCSIDSVLNQTYKEIELIVIDDGSTDASVEVIESYGDRLTCIVQENGGQAAACNRAFAASRGAIVLFLDADDVLYPEAVETVVRHWSPGTAKVQFFLDRIDAAGNPSGGRCPNPPFVADSAIPALLRHYAYYPAPPTSGNAYARDILEILMPAPEQPWRRGLDGYLNALSALYGPVVSIHASHGGYRIHDRNMSGWGALDLAKLRFGMDNEIERANAVKEHARARGEEIPDDLALNVPAHCKARILSLRLDPEGHSLAGDRLAVLGRAGMRAARRFPHLTLRKRVVAMIGFWLLTVVPIGILRPRLSPLFQSEQRSLSAWVGVPKQLRET
jgi:glycosyltransferase involved in cell wall biosynthesis